MPAERRGPVRVSPYEDAARTKKVAALLVVCVEAGMTADQAERATEQQKKLASWAARVRVPSDTSWRLVVDGLRELEQRRRRA